MSQLMLVRLQCSRTVIGCHALRTAILRPYINGLMLLVVDLFTRVCHITMSSVCLSVCLSLMLCIVPQRTTIHATTKVSEQVNRKSCRRNTMVQFSTPTPALSSQIPSQFQPPKLQRSTIGYLSSSWTYCCLCCTENC